MTKKNVESKLAKMGIPASYCGISGLIVWLLCSELGVCD